MRWCGQLLVAHMAASFHADAQAEAKTAEQAVVAESAQQAATDTEDANPNAPEEATPPPPSPAPPPSTEDAPAEPDAVASAPSAPAADPARDAGYEPTDWTGPRPDPGVRTHNGFYFRFGTGGGFFVDSIDSNNFDAAALRGVGVSGELLFGGTPAQGLVIGGGTNGGSVFAPTLEINGRDEPESPEQLALSAFGIFADYYFVPSGGFHAQAFLGYAILQADGSDAGESPDGFAISVGSGHEWWVGEQWSLGIMLRLLYASLSFDPGGLDESHSILLPALLATATYH